jgi:serine/threonine-protein kinase HipA
MNDTIHKSNQPRLTVVGELGGNYIFKTPSITYHEMPENEHLTMRIAEAFGIQTVPACLIRLKSGELAYITKRIDRTDDGKKVHMLDMFQITEAVDKYKSTMEHVGKALKLYSSDMLMDQLKYFELTVFCFLTGNNDMHLKNFSMIHKDNKWSLALPMTY